MPNVQYLFVHTAAADIPNVDAAMIDRWHRERGWSGIGYHFVVLDDRHATKPDGQVETGRSTSKNGAHVLGANGISLGICCAGHGDRRDFTQKQIVALTRLLARLAEEHGVPTENILGHREVNDLVDKGVVGDSFRTTKSCPGTKVDMDAIRGLVEVERSGGSVAPLGMLSAATPDGLAEAIRLIDANRGLLGNAQDEWRAFVSNGEVRALLG